MGDSDVPPWRSNRLWQALGELEAEPAERIRRALDRYMPNVQRVLDSGDSGPGTFTLHDGAHSLRVAERIYELAGTSLIDAMDPYDIGLLLMSAFLHDIGMTPPLAKPRGVVDFLLTGSSEALDPDEIETLQAWLDDAGQAAPPAGSNEPLRAATIARARSLAAEYVRFRHNDWSEAWMVEHLADLDEATYSGCLSDLILLCKSHHYGISELRSDDFEPRFVGAEPATVLHLRFDACLLRVADVLDFDPERTPRILFEHRDVEASSAIFWHKDHELSLVKDGRHISIHARPPDATIHHAVVLTIADVDRELQLCQRLAEETQFHRMTGREADLPHRWHIDTSVRANVKPRNGEYVYMDGTFRPDQERILELLGGVELYGTSMAAVRELLQNAFDAVREQIALERLRQADPAAAATRERIASTHRVSIEVVERGDQVWLVCDDSGCGMSRDLITSRFLVGGSRPSHDTNALERTCNELGFSVGRTSRFGIGVLSYFLLARQMRVHTRQSIDAGGREGTGWAFTSDGLTDFGELRPAERTTAGTTVELLLRDDATTDGPSAFVDQLSSYVREVTRRVPCHFSFPGPDDQPALESVEPGWLDRGSEALDVFLDTMDPGPDSDKNLALYSSHRRKSLEQRSRRWSEVRERAEDAVLVDQIEDELPNGLGRFRVLFGYFEAAGHRLLPFFDISSADAASCMIAPVLGAHAVELGEGFQTSWNGMSVEATTPRDMAGRFSLYPRTPGIAIEIDFTDDAAGELAVDRDTLTLSEQGAEATAYVNEVAEEVQEYLLSEIEGSPFFLINSSASGTALNADGPPLWPVGVAQDEETEIEAVELSSIDFPAIDLGAVDRPDRKVSWRGQEVDTPPELVSVAARGASGDWTWHGSHFKPQIVAAMSWRDLHRPVSLWTAIEPTGELPLPTATFPPTWNAIVSVNLDFGEALDSPTIWNAGNPLLSAVDQSGWDWAAETFRPGADPLDYEAEMLASPSKLAAWILLCISDSDEFVWTGVSDRSPASATTLWNGVKGLADLDAVYVWNEDPEEASLLRIGPGSWAEWSDAEAREEFARIFPLPDPDWRLTQD